MGSALKTHGCPLPMPMAAHVTHCPLKLVAAPLEPMGCTYESTHFDRFLVCTCWRPYELWLLIYDCWLTYLLLGCTMTAETGLGLFETGIWPKMS